MCVSLEPLRANALHTSRVVLKKNQNTFLETQIEYNKHQKKMMLWCSPSVYPFLCIYPPVVLLCVSKAVPGLFFLPSAPC